MLNAIIEADRVVAQGPVMEQRLPTPSGKGQIVCRCRECGVAVFSSYMVRQGKLRYVRVGTLDDPDLCPPRAQIFTSSKQAWVPLDPNIPAFGEFYNFAEIWPRESLDRFAAAMA